MTILQLSHLVYILQYWRNNLKPDFYATIDQTQAKLENTNDD